MGTWKLWGTLLALGIALLASGMARAATLDIQDNYVTNLTITDISGDHVGSESPTISVRRNSDGFYLDWNDTTFKNSAWTTKAATMTEDATNGFYHQTYNPPASESAPNSYLLVYDNADTNDVGAHLTETLTYIYADSSAEISDQTWEEAIADHSGTGGSTAEALSNASAAGDPWSTALPGAYGAGTAGNIIGNNLDAAVSTRATPSDVTVYVGE